ncbi:hypothetical protein FIBSPDRAFT_894500 [Athelia psychrophila]|uniref:Uncharacterized protein n=1 Tax=Athelia psychrophila TaxID=1759441 RepID=A0A166FRU7_9AGAM|nr:hypothetical protein FIBSPDRAFT_894500 [Fibularhizoctonia sp. CBS 109695]
MLRLLRYTEHGHTRLRYEPPHTYNYIVHRITLDLSNNLKRDQLKASFEIGQQQYARDNPVTIFAERFLELNDDLKLESVSNSRGPVNHESRYLALGFYLLLQERNSARCGQAHGPRLDWEDAILVWSSPRPRSLQPLRPSLVISPLPPQRLHFTICGHRDALNRLLALTRSNKAELKIWAAQEIPTPAGALSITGRCYAELMIPHLLAAGAACFALGANTTQPTPAADGPEEVLEVHDTVLIYLDMKPAATAGVWLASSSTASLFLS